MLIAIVRVDVLRILSSRVFLSKAVGTPFNAPFSTNARKVITMYGLVAILLEDVPQVVLQLVRSVYYNYIHIVFFEHLC